MLEVLPPSFMRVRGQFRSWTGYESQFQYEVNSNAHSEVLLLVELWCRNML